MGPCNLCTVEACVDEVVSHCIMVITRDRLGRYIWVLLMYWYRPNWPIKSASVGVDRTLLYSSCTQTTCARKHNKPSQDSRLAATSQSCRESRSCRECSSTTSEVVLPSLGQGSHPVLKGLNFKIVFQDLEKVLNLNKMYIRYGKNFGNSKWKRNLKEKFYRTEFY